MLYKIKNPYINVYQTACKRLQQAGANNCIVLTSRLTVAIEIGADCCCENVLTSNKVSLIILDAAAAKTTRSIVLARPATLKRCTILTLSIYLIYYYTTY